jgi:8-oxo-dGTP pyrophosphatase MutT (NUDIX family)
MTINFCNNCGKVGHYFQDCKTPITSLGIVAFRKNKKTNQNEYFMIRRKDTLGYIDFIRGKYNLSDVPYIEKLIGQMSNYEKQSILEFGFDALWDRLWGDYISVQYRYEADKAKRKFDAIMGGIEYTDGMVYLTDLVKRSETDWSETEWGFPKGRRNYCEKDIDCAIREFEEESGYFRTNLQISVNLLPFEENFIGSNYKSYKHKYYLSYMNVDSGNVSPTFQKSEVSKTAWKSLEECIKCIRPYNIEKIKLITNIDNVLRTYKLYI